MSRILVIGGCLKLERMMIDISSVVEYEVSRSMSLPIYNQFLPQFNFYKKIIHSSNSPLGLQVPLLLIES
jgi:hypothetical protein